MDINRALSLDMDRNLDIERSIVLEREVHLILAVARPLAQSIARNHNGVLRCGIDHNFDKSLDRYVDLHNLYERIAGRSPAFEGIRLVKQRKKQ